MMPILRFIRLGFVAVLAGCQAVPDRTGKPDPVVQTAPLDPARCSSATIAVDADFPSGGFASCTFQSPENLVVRIEPENEPPINCSPWYAMRLTPLHSQAEVQQVILNLSYDVCGHRYWPKISTDGKNWRRLEPEKVSISEVRGVRQARLTIDLHDEPLWLAAQEIIQPADYSNWLDEISQSLAVDRWILGTSAQGREIPGLTIKAPGANPAEQIVLIGRQHPPEITGAIAMKVFVEETLTDTPLAARFRKRFEITVVPMVNPDGVVHGYWRNNTAGTDLNRDWGPFVQPETRLLQGLLKNISGRPNKRLRLFLDFHSTGSDVFYTIPDDLPTDPVMFTRDWLENLQKRMPEYEVRRDPGHNAGLPTSKTYVYAKYGVPTATFEIGDETDRELIHRIAREAARAMMETLLMTPKIFQEHLER